MKNQALITSFCFLLLFPFLWIGCQKEENDALNSSGNCLEEYVFTVGVNRGVSIHKFDSAIQIRDEDGYNFFYALDLNQDQIDDISFRSDEERIGGDLDYQRAGISMINRDSISISSTLYRDSVHLCVKTVNDSLVDEYYYYKSLCSCSSSSSDTTYEINDRLTSLSSFYNPNIHTFGEVIQNPSWYKDVDFTLAYNQSKRFNPASNSVKYCYTNELWNAISESYVVFKYGTGAHAKMGWIKISVSNYYQIQIHEVAIEN